MSALDEAASRAEAAAELNAFITIDPQSATQPGAVLGGLPIVVKDNIAVAGFALTGGTPQLADNHPSSDAGVVARLRAAGASIVGTTSLHELACGVTGNNGWSGPARNPVNPTRVAGGSSSGTAIAVAAGVVSVGLGTDTGGSCRIPAAFCGVTGFRPTTGRYPSDGLLTIVPTRDTVGVIGNCVPDIIRIDSLIADDAATIGGTIGSLTGKRFGRVTAYLDMCSQDVRAQIDRTVDLIADHGAYIVDVPGHDLLDLVALCDGPIALWEIRGSLERFLSSARMPPLSQFIEGVASPDVKAMLSAAASSNTIPEAVYRAAISVHRPALMALVAQLWAQVDVLIGPTTAMTAPPIGDDAVTLIDGREVPVFATLTATATLSTIAALPSISLPCGRTPAGLPVGLLLDGPHHSDRELLALASQVETVLRPITTKDTP